MSPNSKHQLPPDLHQLPTQLAMQGPDTASVEWSGAVSRRPPLERATPPRVLMLNWRCLVLRSRRIDVDPADWGAFRGFEH